MQIKNLDFYGGIEGKIIGEIEISTSVKIKAKVKDAQGVPEKNIAELSIGANSSSSITLTSPFELNENGNLDTELRFSGVELKIWFTASLNLDEEDSKEPVKSIPLVGSFNLKKEIEF